MARISPESSCDRPLGVTRGVLFRTCLAQESPKSQQKSLAAEHQSIRATHEFNHECIRSGYQWAKCLLAEWPVLHDAEMSGWEWR